MKYSKQRKIECQRSLFESIFFVAAGSFVVLLLYFGCDKAISPEKEFSGEPQAEESRENVDGSSYGKEIEEAVSILESEEQEQLQEAAISAAEGCADLYKDIKVLDTTFYQLGQRTKEQRRETVSRMGGLGYVSVSKGINMENYEEVEMFYSRYSDGEEAQVTICDIYGEIGRASCRERV